MLQYSIVLHIGYQRMKSSIPLVQEMLSSQPYYSLCICILRTICLRVNSEWMLSLCMAGQAEIRALLIWGRSCLWLHIVVQSIVKRWAPELVCPIWGISHPTFHYRWFKVDPRAPWLPSGSEHRRKHTTIFFLWDYSRHLGVLLSVGAWASAVHPWWAACDHWYLWNGISNSRLPIIKSKRSVTFLTFGAVVDIFRQVECCYNKWHRTAVEWAYMVGSLKKRQLCIIWIQRKGCYRLKVIPWDGQGYVQDCSVEGHWSDADSHWDLRWTHLCPRLASRATDETPNRIPEYIRPCLLVRWRSSYFIARTCSW